MAHVVCGVDKDLLPLDLPVHLIDKLIVVHLDFFLASEAERIGWKNKAVEEGVALKILLLMFEPDQTKKLFK